MLYCVDAFYRCISDLLVWSRSRAARFRAAQFRAAQYRAERFNAGTGGGGAET